MDEKDSYAVAALVFNCGSGDAGCGMFPLVDGRPRCSASWPVWTRRTVFFEFVAALAVGICSGMCMAGFAVCTPRAVFASFFVMPKMLDTLASMDQKGSNAARIGCARRRYGSGMSTAGMLVSMPHALCSFLIFGRPVMPGIMDVCLFPLFCVRTAILVVPAHDGSDPWLLIPAPSVFACTAVRTGLRACSSLSLEMAVSAAAMVSQTFSPMLWATYGAVLRVELHGDEPENPTREVEGPILDAVRAQLPQIPSSSR